MKQILDLHIHSKYSRACSRDLELPNIAQACHIRGIDIVATGDFTHPGWFEHMKDFLVEDTEGIYKLKKQDTTSNFQLPQTKFIIGTEIASIKKHKDQTRRIHLCIFAPNLEVAEKFNNRLSEMGFNLKSDGRPILGLTSKQILEIMLETDERMVMIPAHAWTPWFGILGSKGGYDSLDEAFEELTPYVRAIETGLSSDPLMNWRCSWLDTITLVSNSDAHSTAKLGREANVIEFDSEKDITYTEIMRIIGEGDRKNFLYTIEFYPEGGKYHWDGHRDCKFSCSPEETVKYKGICPVCKKHLVIGVESRVHELSDRNIEQAREVGAQKMIAYKSLVPLPEIIADAFECGVQTKRVRDIYDNIIKQLGSEFHVLIDVHLSEIEKASSKQIAQAVERVRGGKIFVKPGFDGEFGVVKVFEQGERRTGMKQAGLDFD